MRVIVNPYATTTSARLKQLVVYALQGRFEVDVGETERRDHATELARDGRRARATTSSCAFGGDGTVNEVANGLAGTDTVLTCLPGGATNVYHRMIGIPTDVVDATEHLLRLADDWHPRAIDIARVNDRWFTFAAGRRPRRRRSSSASTAARGSRRASARCSTRSPRPRRSCASTCATRRTLIAEIGGEEYRGVTVAVQNTQPYTYFGRRPVTLSEGATLDLGRPLRRGARARQPARHPRDGATGCSRPARGSATTGASTRSTASTALRVRSADERPVPLQVDGDYIGAHEEAVFTILPGGLRIVG